MPNKSVASIPISCNKDCGGGCPLLATVERGRVTRITNNPLGGPTMSGCVRGFQMPRVLYAPDRLKKPLLRTGPRGSGEFSEVEWPHALDLVAGKLAGVKARHGNEAILFLGGSGSCRGALHNTHRLTARFLGLFGGYTETYGSYSSGAADFATPFVLGTSPPGIDPGTLQFSELIVLWGANVADTRMGCETEARIREARDRGVEVIVIDPRRSRTVARLGTRWIPVRPGTDAALMLAVLYVLITEGLVDKTCVETYSVGFDELKQYVLGQPSTGSSGRCVPKTPQWAEKICGTPAGTIVQFARQYGHTHPTALIPGLSIQRTIGGEEAARLTIALQVATGNLGVPGGSSGALKWRQLPRPWMGGIGVPANPVQARVPQYRWPDVILEGRRGGYSSDVKAVYNVGGNYLVQGSDVHKNVRAFNALEFAVCHDYFLTPTALHCDVVLPATTFLERDDVVFPDGGNYLLFSNQAVPPLPEARNDYDIFCELADRLGFLAEFSEGRSDEEWLRSFVAASEVPDYEAFKRTGIYWGENQLRVGLSDFVADPQAHPLDTPSGRVEISSAAYAGTGYSPIPEYRGLQPDDRHPLRLITPHPRTRTHSQCGNIPWFKERERQALWIHPRDAAGRQIADGQAVCVSSPQGRVRIAARVTGDITPGVVSLLEGVWPAFDPDGTDTAGSPNVLTSTVPTQPSECSRTHSVLVQVKRDA
ncbi:MAG TPA: molybdopterin-dependent oxidoreductase [Anaerolineae bacterium]|nr:molybdopterin-dependent oxidoreductase [Anaerolineae bacterium]